MVDENKLKEVKKEEKSELRYLIRDFYELQQLFEIINIAHLEMTKNNSAGAKAEIKKALKKIRGGIFAGEARIERRLARTFARVKSKVMEIEPSLEKRHSEELKEINRLLTQAEVYNSFLEKLGSRGGGIQKALEDAERDLSKLDPIIEVIKKSKSKVQSFEELIKMLIHKEDLIYQFELKHKEKLQILEGPKRVMSSEETEFDLNKSLTHIKYDNLRYAIEVTMVGLLAWLDDSDFCRVAAIGITPDGKEFKTFNDYFHALGHAEVECLIKVKKEGSDWNGLKIIVGDQPCYSEIQVALKETSDSIIETTVKGGVLTNQKMIRKLKKNKESGSGFEREEELSYENIKRRPRKRKVIERKFGRKIILSEVVDGIAIPREEYEIINSDKEYTYAIKRDGCSVTLSYAGLSEVIFLREDKLYGDVGVNFLKKHVPQVYRIDNYKLKKINDLIKTRKPKQKLIWKAFQDLMELDRIFCYSILKGYKRVKKMFSDINSYEIVVEKEKPAKIEVELRKSLHREMKKKNQLEVNVIRNILNKIRYAELEKRKKQATFLHPGKIKPQLVKIKEKLDEHEILEIIQSITRENERIIVGDFSTLSVRINEVQQKYVSATSEEKVLLEQELRQIENELRYGKNATSKPTNEKYSNLVSLIYENITLKKYLPIKFNEVELNAIADEFIEEKKEIIERASQGGAIGMIMGYAMKKFGKHRVDGALFRKVLARKFA